MRKTYLILQYSTLESTVVQYNSWHIGLATIKWRGKNSYWLQEVGDGRAEGSPVIGVRGHVAISLTPHVDGTGAKPLPDAILSTLLTKWSHNVWVIALSFLVIEDMVAQNCILSGCSKLHVPFYAQVLCLKSKRASSNKENPLAVSCVMNLFSSSARSATSLLLLHLLPDILGLNKRFCTTAFYTVLNNKVHKSLSTCSSPVNQTCELS